MTQSLLHMPGSHYSIAYTDFTSQAPGPLCASINSGLLHSRACWLAIACPVCLLKPLAWVNQPDYQARPHALLYCLLTLCLSSPGSLKQVCVFNNGQTHLISIPKEAHLSMSVDRVL